MSRYTEPKGKVNRRLSLAVYESAGARRALERRNTPPGMHTRRPKLSTYGEAMLEKQKLKHYYGLGERTLRRMFDMARRTSENTGAGLLVLCERRLDNVVRRAGLAKTRPQARQGITHGHFLVNGRKVDKPTFQVRVGDIVSVKNRPALGDLYNTVVQSGTETEIPVWLSPITGQLAFRVSSLPGAEDVSLPVNINQVVELLSR